METRSNTQKKNLIETKDCFVGISAEEKIRADTALNKQKNEVDPDSLEDINAVLNEEIPEEDPVTSNDFNESSSRISMLSSYILGFGGFIVTCLVAILLYRYT